MSVPVRVRVLGLLFLLAFVNYLLRNNLSIALPSIRSEFSLSAAELGWILGSFNFTYALFQIPGGLFGDRFGPRRALGLIAVTWGVLTLLTGFAPGLFAASATGAVVSLMIVRLLTGITHAPLFPVCAAAISRWFPPGHWGLPNATMSAGLTLGQASIGPIVTFLIITFGWRESFYLMAPLAFIAAAWFYGYVRDTPREHSAVSTTELQWIESGRQAGGAVPLQKRDVLLLAASYGCMNYVFYIFAQWLFTYLVEERGFSLLESGFLYAAPFLTGAVFSILGGFCCDRLTRRFGPRQGCRLPAIVALLLVAALLLAGVNAPNPYIAVMLLSLCFGFTQFTEGIYWSATTYVAGTHTGTATGILNTGGNLAGLLAPVVGLMVDRLGWNITFASGALFAVLAAVLWLYVLKRPNV
jgi:MFS transporter, ACS family, glucarate transporter